MWEFDEADYLVQFLGPMLSRFAAEARLPDLFARYALPLDISDQADIEEALNTLPARWHRHRQGPARQLAAALLDAAEQSEARCVLLDPEARRSLRAALEREQQRAPSGRSADADRPAVTPAWTADDEDRVAALFEPRAPLAAASPQAAVADVQGCAAQDLGSYVLLRWRWPDSCSQVTVAWRRHDFPTAPSDPRAICRRVTRAEYERQGGVRFEDLEVASHYFGVFAMGVCDGDGELAFAPGSSAGARCALYRRPSAVVSYSIRRQWLQRRRVTLELRTDTLIDPLPPLLLLAKPGEFQPIDRKDGTVLAELGWLRLGPEEPLRIDVDLPPLRTALYLRAFFADLPTQRGYRLVDPPCEQLKIPAP